MKRLSLLICSFLSVFIAAAQGEKATKQDDRLKIYPETTNTYLNVYVEWPEIRPFTLSMYNSKDEKLEQWKDKGSDTWQKAIYVDKLPEGKYYIVLVGGKDTVTRGFTVSARK